MYSKVRRKEKYKKRVSEDKHDLGNVTNLEQG